LSNIKTLSKPEKLVLAS